MTIPTPDTYQTPKLTLVSPKVPETASWLSEKEKAFIQARLPPNAPRAREQHFQWREIVESLKDVRLWLFTFIWAFYTVGTSGVRFYQSTVIADLGFTQVFHITRFYRLMCKLTIQPPSTGASPRPNC